MACTAGCGWAQIQALCSVAFWSRPTAAKVLVCMPFQRSKSCQYSSRVSVSFLPLLGMYECGLKLEGFHRSMLARRWHTARCMACWIAQVASGRSFVVLGCSLLWLISVFLSACIYCAIMPTIKRQFWDFLKLVDGDVKRSEEYLQRIAGAFMANGAEDEFGLIGFDVIDAKTGAPTCHPSCL